MVQRDGVMIMLKQIAPEIHPQPNHSRHEWARWDAYIHTSEPDSLYQEYVSRGVPMHMHLKDTEDGLRAFEITDNNGYVLCFGRPRESWLKKRASVKAFRAPAARAQSCSHPSHISRQSARRIHPFVWRQSLLPPVLSGRAEHPYRPRCS